MADDQTPKVLIVDDREEQSAFKLQLENDQLATVTLRHPQDIERDDLLEAQLVLVDYQLDNWNERDSVEALGLKPPDGLALSCTLRRIAHESEQASPTAFAIHTGQIEKLAAPLPADHREHALARINNVEWIFKKSQVGRVDRRAIQVIEIANAVQKLPRLWSGSDCLEQLADLLGIGNDNIRNELITDIESCLPPIHELSKWSHGLAVLRWLLHRILPYPCFLWDSFQIAARLRLDHSDLALELSEGKSFRKALDQCEYGGILSRFAGTRWWRTRIELVLWEASKGGAIDVESLHELVFTWAGRRIKPSIPKDHPIIVLNSDYQPSEQFASIDQAVRIRPDDWPPYADPAWATIDSARSEKKTSCDSYAR